MNCKSNMSTRQRRADATLLCCTMALSSLLLTQNAHAFSPHLLKSMTAVRPSPSSSQTNTNTNANTISSTQAGRCPFHMPLEMVATLPTKIMKRVDLRSPDEETRLLKEKVEAKARQYAAEKEVRKTLDVRMHGVWYNLSGWRKAHPAGAHWIDWYDGRDATEVMDAFHSDRARKMLPRLPKSKPETADMLENSVPKDTNVQIEFRKLRDKLEADGWWKRDIKREVRLVGIWTSLVIGAALTTKSIPALSIWLLSLSFTQAGWLGHDYIHGIDKWTDKFRMFATVCGGLGATWWSDKHNKHHALTNEMGVDEDLATDPFLFTWAPSPENDSPMRKIQHYIFWMIFSALFALWRVDTVQVIIQAVKEKRPKAKKDFYAIGIHYAVLFALFPIKVWLPSVFVSGLLSALIVTPTHQDEEMFDEFQMDWVTAQFRSTRNAVTTNPFSEWLWGGMQYQLEHHLFPTMPRSNYPKLKPILQKFCDDVGLEDGYRETNEFKILYDNWKIYKKVAKMDPVEGALCSRGDGQLGAIDMSASPAAMAARKKAEARATGKSAIAF